MFEKVNPMHPDKIADRIAGALVDLAYKIRKNPKIAVEVLIGHGECNIIVETNSLQDSHYYMIKDIVKRISRQDLILSLKIVPQDEHLANNQDAKIRCGDNGIFKGVRTNAEEEKLASIASYIYSLNNSDGKYILNNDKLIVCQSNCKSRVLKNTLIDEWLIVDDNNIKVNPLGDWTGGTDVDTGATNRKLGSDMGRAVTGGGLHGKDLSKADVSVNIYAFLKAQETGKDVELCCAIGDETIDGKPYEEIVEIARDYIKSIGGFEKLAEWGLIR